MSAWLLRLLGGPATLQPILIALAVSAVVSGFVGWKVRDWQCDAAQTKAAQQALKKATEAVNVVNEQAGHYEDTRASIQSAGSAAEGEVRVVYRDAPAVPADCAPPPDVERVLSNAVSRANASASGEPSEQLP